MLTRYYLSAFLLAATCGLAQAQRFDPGFLVKTSGDTLRGEIENNFWVEPPQEIRLRTSPNKPITVHKAADISSFALINGRYFRRELLPLDRSAETQIARLPSGLVFRQKPEMLLAEVLVDGEASLLRLILPGAVHFWVRREKAEYLELAERKYMRKVNGRMAIADGNNYKAQLRNYFGDCNQVAQAADATPYTAEGLIKLVQLYNQECAATRQAGTNFARLDESKPRIVVNGGLISGIRLNTLRLHSYDRNGALNSMLDGVNIDNRPHLMGGLYLDILDGGRRAALHFDLNVSTYGQAGQLSAPGVPDVSYVWRGNLGTARLGGRHFIPVGSQSRIFYGAGVLLEYSWNHKNLLEYATSTPTGKGAYFLREGALSSIAYLEVGARRDRFTFALDACPYRKIGYNDYLSSDPNNGGYNAYLGHLYNARPWSFSATLGFRLHRDYDALVAP